MQDLFKEHGQEDRYGNLFEEYSRQQGGGEPPAKQAHVFEQEAPAPRQRMPEPEHRQRMPQPAVAAPAQQAPAQEAATQHIQRMPQPAMAGGAPAPGGYTDDPTRIGSPAVDLASAGGGKGGSGARGGGGNGSGGGKKGGGKGGRKKRKGGVFKRMVLNMLKAAFAVFCAGVILVCGIALWVSDYVVEATRNDEWDLENYSSSEKGYWLRPDGYGGFVEFQEIVGDEETVWTPLDEISQYVIDALIATEDRTFWEHNGFSLKNTIGAGLNQIFGFRGNSYGASTIDQQLVKNLTGDAVVFDEDGTGMTAGYLRKLREIFRAIGLNNNYTKDVILTVYLNTMPLSGNVVGVGAGAQKYFDKLASELTIWEAATIVGITNHPYRYNPYTRPDDCLKRRDDVLTFMWNEEYITEAEYRHALQQPLGIVENSSLGEYGQVVQVNSWYTDAAYYQIINDMVENGMAETTAEASKKFYNSGWRVELSMDPEIQAIVEDLYAHAYDEDSWFPIISTYAKDANGNTTDEIVYNQSSIVIMDYEGRVLAIAGGLGEKESNLVFNRATMSKRQVGSTMKMMAAYALGIDVDVINWSSMFENSALLTQDGKLPGPEQTATWPRNYAGQGNGERLTVQRGIAESLNTIAVRVGYILELEDMYEFVTETLNVSTMVKDSSADYTYSSMVLGGNYEGMYNLELTSAYAMYGNNGVYYEPRFYERVLDSDGNVIMTSSNYSIKVLSDESAFILNRLMRTVMTDARGTARGMSPDRFDSIAKTGTTNEDNDRWLVGLTPYYVTGIWYGYDDNYYIQAGVIQNNPNTIIWRNLMNILQADLEDKSFPAQPSGVVQRQFCTVSGYLAGEGCPTDTGYYKDTPSGLPDTCDGNHEIYEAPEE